MNTQEPLASELRLLLGRIATCSSVRMGSPSDKLDSIHAWAVEALSLMPSPESKDYRAAASRPIIGEGSLYANDTMYKALPDKRLKTAIGGLRSIAYGDAKTWPNCSAREVAKQTLRDCGGEKYAGETGSAALAPQAAETDSQAATAPESATADREFDEAIEAAGVTRESVSDYMRKFSSTTDRGLAEEPTEAMCDAARGFILGLDLDCRSYGAMQNHLDLGGYDTLPEIRETAEKFPTQHITKWAVAAHIWGLMAKAAQSKTATGWQPIETAPKRGRVLLSAEGQTCYGHWYEPQSRWEYDGYDFGNPESQPTHWMPLPPPVSAEA